MDIDQAWKRALEYWGIAIALQRPTISRKNEDPIAYIDLRTREVVLNKVRVEAQGLEDCLDALLAHELGHHLHYPHSLATQARLELLEQEILPIRGYSLLNLFTDFLINCELGKDPAMQKQLAHIYQSMPDDEDAAKKDPAFFFYLTCFEEAWMVEPRLLTRKAGEILEADFPGARAEAQRLAEELPQLAPNIFTQLIYFASVVSRYQPIDQGAKSKVESINPTAGDHSRPDAGDYADALERGAQEKEAIKKAIGEGWLKADQVPDGEASRRKRAAALPGVLAGQPQKLAEAMAIHYRRLADKYLIKPPPNELTAEPIIPSTLSQWEMGDAPKEIDWRASVGQGGINMAVISPLKRDFVDDDPTAEVREFRARLEIYLDTSGSMPDPKLQLNPMTLAAQVLALSCVRHDGLVRALIYSTNFVQHWAWTRGEMEISRFLMSYIGGGTLYPFPVLSQSVKEHKSGAPIRIVLTDSDFHHNLSTAGAAEIVSQAAKQSPFICLLNNASDSDEWVKSIARLGVKTIGVKSMVEFPKTAAALAKALFHKDES